MSRSSVFSRIASWLKNASNLNDYRRQREALGRVHRQYTVQNLEDRHMLDASFEFISATDDLLLENFSETVSESLEIGETANAFTFQLGEGNWSQVGGGDPGITGAGTSTLRIDKTIGPTIDLLRIEETLGMAMNFSGANYADFTDFIIDTDRGEITQTPLSELIFTNFSAIGAETLELREVVNDFRGDVTIIDTNFARIRDGGEIKTERIDVNFDAEIENNGRMFINGEMTIGGDLLLNSNEGDIRQEADAPVTVQGKTRLKSNGGGVSAGAEIYLAFGDRDGDGVNDNDFVGHVEILLGSNIDIRDSNDLLLGDANTVPFADINQYYAESENGNITVDGLINVPGDEADVVGTLFLRSSVGISQTAQGTLVSDALILLGEGDIILDGQNKIFDNGNNAAGLLSIDVFGDLVFNNEEDIQFSGNTYTYIPPGTSTTIRAARVRQDDGTKGNMTISTSDDNVTQTGDAPVIVDETTTFDVGTGNVTLDYGDELGDLLNDNNWNRIDILSAGTVSFVDENAIVVGDVAVTNDARFMAENDQAIEADGAIVIGNNILFQTETGVSQTSGSIEAVGLAAQGSGDFKFDLVNKIGDAATRGKVAASIEEGEFSVDNLFGLETSTITAFGETVTGIDGIEVSRARLRGSEIAINEVVNSLFVYLESDSSISQTAVITTDALLIRSNDVTNLGAANNVGILAAQVDGEFLFNNDIELSIGKLAYDGTEVSGIQVENGLFNNFTLSTTDDDVMQNLDGPVIVEDVLDINIGTGCITLNFGDGDGDTFNDNDFDTLVVTSALQVEIVDRNTITTNSINVAEQIRIQSEIGGIDLEGNLTATNMVLLQAADGVSQAAGTGVISTAALMLQGQGDFLLNNDNEVGSPTTNGEIAVDINGAFEFNNIYALTSKQLTYTLKDLSTITINGFNITTANGALVLNVNGLTIETEIVAPKIVINTNGDIIQTPSGRLITDELVLSGVGDFDLNAMNQIGTALVPGVVAINVIGDVELTNEFALNFGEIVCGPDTFLGISLAPGATSDGDLTFTTVNGDINQVSDSVMTVAGITTFDVGTGMVNLTGFPDSDNDFNILRVTSADRVEVADSDGITIEEAFIANNFMVRSGETIPSEIVLDDNIVVGGQMLLVSLQGVSQQRGGVTAGALLLDGASNFDLLLSNGIASLSANVNGDISFNNTVDLVFEKQSYLTLAGATHLFNGIDVQSTGFNGNLIVSTSNDNVSQASDAHLQVAKTSLFDLGGGTLDLTGGDSNGDFLNDNDLNVLAIASAGNTEVVDQNSISLDNVSSSGSMMIESEGGSISLQGQVIGENQILLKALTGVGTAIDAFVVTDELLLEGDGEFNLNGNNQIGQIATSGQVAVDVAGDVILHNTFGLNFDDLTFTQMSGAATNIAGVSVTGVNGDLFVQAGGDITDSDLVDLAIDGHADFVAGGGSDVELGGVNSLTSASIGLGGRNATIIKNDAVVLNGVDIAGDLQIQSAGGFTQSAVDESGLVGSRYINVDGTAVFTLDSSTGLTEDLNFNLMVVNNSLVNNRFGGDVLIQGSTFTGSGTGNGQLGSVQLRNSILDTAVFPTINTMAGDQLTSLTVWAPNSSLSIRDLGAGTDYDVISNMTIYAGTDSETGLVGDTLKVTDNSKTRSLRDEEGVEMIIGGNLNTNAANTLILADSVDDAVNVAGTLSLVNQGGANENRIRVGVGSGGLRGDDSGATVNADQVRTRANRNGADGHVTINLDSDVMFTGGNFATSLVVVSGGEIADAADAAISVANAAFFDANAGAGNIDLGDDNATNRTIFGSVGFLGNNVSFTEDTSAILNGSSVAGTLDAFVKGSLRQSGLDRQGRAGTAFLEVNGDVTLTVDGDAIPGDHVRDSLGKDVRLMANSSQDLMDNVFGGAVNINTTQHLSGGNGTLRHVEVRNVGPNAAVPVFGISNADPLKSMTLWHTNSSIDLVEQSTVIDYHIKTSLNLYAGVDSDNGKTTGGRSIVDDSVRRDVTDAANVTIFVAGNMEVHSSNGITLVDDSSNSLVVERKSSFLSEGGLQGNAIDVGSSLTVRGDDSGGTFETRTLKYLIEDTGVGGDVTVVADLGFFVDNTSAAPSVVLRP